jgi:hypothetical protein
LYSLCMAGRGPGRGCAAHLSLRPDLRQRFSALVTAPHYSKFSVVVYFLRAAFVNRSGAYQLDSDFNHPQIRRHR